MTPDYLRLDQQPLLAQYLLFPRRDLTPPPAGAFDLLVSVEPGSDVQVAVRFYLGQPDWPALPTFTEMEKSPLTTIISVRRTTPARSTWW